jgi:hypothetical protein
LAGRFNKKIWPAGYDSLWELGRHDGFVRQDLTASIGMAHCTTASRVMDIMLSAKAAMRAVAKQGGDAIRVGQLVQDESLVASS